MTATILTQEAVREIAQDWMRAFGQPVQGQRRAQEVATGMLSALADVRRQGHIGVQREALQASTARLVLVYHHRG